MASRPTPARASARSPSRAATIFDWLSDRVIHGFVWLMLRLPYDLRMRIGPWLVTTVLAPVAGYRARIRNNLARILPDLPGPEVERLVREVPRNIGRTMLELYSAPEFMARIRAEPLTGPGVSDLEQAHAAGRPVMLVTGHIGNYDAVRAALLSRGYPVGGLYKPMKNRFFNDNYVRAISRIGTPLFPRSRAGMTDMIRFLRSGGMVGIVVDQFIKGGVPLDFMGRPAITSLAAAEMALRYDALVIPCYGIRRPGGDSFELLIERPIPPGTPEAMTQALNHSLEAQVRRNPGQWMWTHGRWKTAGRGQQRRRAGDGGGP